MLIFRGVGFLRNFEGCTLLSSEKEKTSISLRRRENVILCLYWWDNLTQLYTSSYLYIYILIWYVFIHLSMGIRLPSLTNQNFHGSYHWWMLLLYTWGEVSKILELTKDLFEAHPSNHGVGWDPWWEGLDTFTRPDFGCWFVGNPESV